MMTELESENVELSNRCKTLQNELETLKVIILLYQEKKKNQTYTLEKELELIKKEKN